MGTQRNLSVSIRPIPPAALPPLSWRRHFSHNLTTGSFVVLFLAALAAWTAPRGDTLSAALPLQPKPTTAPTSKSTTQQIQTHISSQNGQAPHASVTVNGQTVTVPANGTSQQIINSPDGSRTTVTVSGSQSSNGSSFTQTMVNSTTSSVVQQNNQEEVVP
jgi:hypothetical protein